MKRHLLRLGTAAAACLPLVAIARPALASGPTFACDPGFYQVISGQLAGLAPATGTYTNIGTKQPAYNAMSYRIADGYMYAIRNADLLRIDANGVVSTLATLNVVPGAYTGVFGDDGMLHISRGGQDWYAVDVATFQATRINALSQNKSVADLANISGVFYGVSSANVLWKFDPVAGTVTSGGTVSGLPAGSSVYGAAWSTAGGNLYVGRNTGEVFQISGFSTGSPVATQVAMASATSSNDGASCELAAPPAGIADIDGATPEVAPTTPEAIAAAESYATSYQSPSYSVPDAGLGTGAACPATVDEDRPARVQVDPASMASPTVLYENPFNANANGFQVLSGSWLQQDGSYRQLNTCGFDYTTLLTEYSVSWFDLDVVFHAVTGPNMGGVLINQSSVNTRSGAMLIDLADDGATLRWGFYDSAGYYQNVGWDQIPAPAPGEPVTLKIESRGENVTMWHNGNNVATVQTANPGGMVGLVASQTQVAFDSVTLTAVPQP